MGQIDAATQAQIWLAIGSIILAFVGAVGAVITMSVGYLRKKFALMEAQLDTQLRALEANTEITQNVEKATNGNLIRYRNEAQKYRLLAERYRRIVKLINATEAGRKLIDQVMQGERHEAADPAFDELERRLMEPPSP